MSIEGWTRCRRKTRLGACSRRSRPGERSRDGYRSPRIGGRRTPVLDTRPSDFELLRILPESLTAGDTLAVGHGAKLLFLQIDKAQVLHTSPNRRELETGSNRVSQIITVAYHILTRKILTMSIPRRLVRRESRAGTDVGVLQRLKNTTRC